MNRRQLLKTSSVGVLGGLAGCSSSVSTPTQDRSGGNGGSNREEDMPESETFDGLGKTAIYRRGEDSRLRITPAEARFEDAILTARSSRISSQTPENPDHSFLLVRIDLENTGSETVTAPGEITVRIDGSQYDSSYTSPPDGESYSNYNEIHPESSQTGWVVYEVPPVTDGPGEIIIQGSGINAATATWTVDLSSLDRVEHDYTGMSLSRGTQFGTESIKFSIVAADIETTNGYTYSGSGDYEFEAEPGDGDQFALAHIQAENTGENPVTVPTVYDMSLIAGNSQADAGRYRRESDAYEGGEIASGVVREGYVQFEIPESASPSEFRVSLTRDLTATWTTGE